MKIKGGTSWLIEVNTIIDQFDIPYPKSLVAWFWIDLLLIIILTFYLYGG